LNNFPSSAKDIQSNNPSNLNKIVSITDDIHAIKGVPYSLNTILSSADDSQATEDDPSSLNNIHNSADDIPSNIHINNTPFRTVDIQATAGVPSSLKNISFSSDNTHTAKEVTSSLNNIQSSSDDMYFHATAGFPSNLNSSSESF
jgi:hypothetical protein